MRSVMKTFGVCALLVMVTGPAYAQSVSGTIDDPVDYDIFIDGNAITGSGTVTHPHVYPHTRVVMYQADLFWQSYGPQIANVPVTDTGNLGFDFTIANSGHAEGRYLLKLKMYSTFVDEVRIFIKKVAGGGGAGGGN